MRSKTAPPSVLHQRLELAGGCPDLAQPVQPSLHQSGGDSGATNLLKHVDVELSWPAAILELRRGGVTSVAAWTVSQPARARNRNGPGLSTNRYWRIAWRDPFSFARELSMQPGEIADQLALGGRDEQRVGSQVDIRQEVHRCLRGLVPPNR